MRKKIGTFLVEKGYLTQEQVREVRIYSEKTGKKFGDAAVEMGLVTQEQLQELFGQDFAVNFFHIDTKTFPRTTLDLFPVEEVLKWGCMPCGFKTEVVERKEVKILNLGFLEPSDTANVQAVMKGLKGKEYGKSGRPNSVDPYLLLPDQFVEVLLQVYAIRPERYAVLLKTPGAVYPKVKALLDAHWSGKKAA
ncbi:MAG: hypothetical protein IT285_04215 [Bdellovibrionales bacterium]|nr:hypothetical protein [Bdellovibrionales bacterium]